MIIIEKMPIRGQLLKYWKMATVAKPAAVHQNSTFLIFSNPIIKEISIT